MDPYEALTREQLLALVRAQTASVAELQATFKRLEARIEELERRQEKGGPRGMPGLKPSPAPGWPAPEPRKPRAQGFARGRATPTETVDHALDRCPDCGTTLNGGWVKRTREVLEITPTPARVIEHRFLERECPLCRTRRTPAVDLGERVLGRQRLGIGLISLIVRCAKSAVCRCAPSRPIWRRSISCI